MSLSLLGTTNGDMMPSIYVASLSDYNNAILHGVWIDLKGMDADDVMTEVQAMLKASPTAAEYGDVAEEWAIHDYDGFGALNLGEWASFEECCAWSEQIEQHGEAFMAYAYLFETKNIETLGDEFDDKYIGEMSVLDYAYDYIAESGMLDEVPESIRSYFNYEAFARDLVIGGDIIEHDGYLFHGF